MCKKRARSDCFWRFPSQFCAAIAPDGVLTANPLQPVSLIGLSNSKPLRRTTSTSACPDPSEMPLISAVTSGARALIRSRDVAARCRASLSCTSDNNAKSRFRIAAISSLKRNPWGKSALEWSASQDNDGHLRVHIVSALCRMRKGASLSSLSRHGVK